jgi:hypothetical protein
MLNKGRERPVSAKEDHDFVDELYSLLWTLTSWMLVSVLPYASPPQP